MPNFQLKNDEVRTWTNAMFSRDAAGDNVPNPGAVYSVISVTPPVINAVVNGLDVSMNATGPNTNDVVVLFGESGGTPEANFPWHVDVVDDLTPASAFFDANAASTSVPQAVPAQS